MQKVAILQVADTGPLESLIIMLRSIGVQCYLPNKQLRNKLREIGCDTVLEIDSLVHGWGYDQPLRLPEADLTMLDKRRDVIYVDVKAHRNYGKVVQQWPHMDGRILWYRINGGKPEHVIRDGVSYGDEVNPPCPVLTPNMWYKSDIIDVGNGSLYSPMELGWAYACWPPFYRSDEYYPVHGRTTEYEAPMCLIHNLEGWGYAKLVPQLRALGVRCYGVRSPDGLVPHHTIPQRLSRALALVHMKSSDAPGYALYEALAAGCPVVCTRRLIWRCRMQDLLIPGKTCLVFDRETHEGLSDRDVASCAQEVARHLQALADPAYNQRIGLAGRQQLSKIMWDERKDQYSLYEFMTKHF